MASSVPICWLLPRLKTNSCAGAHFRHQTVCSLKTWRIQENLVCFSSQSSCFLLLSLQQLPVVTSSTIVRCRSCRTYINPFVSFLDQRRWKCNLCYRVNDGEKLRRDTSETGASERAAVCREIWKRSLSTFCFSKNHWFSIERENLSVYVAIV